MFLDLQSSGDDIKDFAELYKLLSEGDTTVVDALQAVASVYSSPAQTFNEAIATIDRAALEKLAFLAVGKCLEAGEAFTAIGAILNRHGDSFGSLPEIKATFGSFPSHEPLPRPDLRLVVDNEPESPD